MSDEKLWEEGSAQVEKLEGSPESRNRRQSPRVLLNLPVRFHLCKEGRLITPGEIVNYSDYGLCLSRLDHPLEIGSQIEIEILQPQAASPIVLRGIVVWVKSYREEEKKWKMGISVLREYVPQLMASDGLLAKGFAPDRRRFARTPLNVPVQYRLPGAGEAEEWRHAESVDFSPSGMGLLIEEKQLHPDLKPEIEILMCFRLPEVNVRFKREAKVKWICAGYDADRRKTFFRCGVQFRNG